MASTEVSVEGRKLRLSNLDKVLYPQSGFTKAQVIDYYTRAGPTILEHLRGRALTLKRYPDGVESEFFYEKQCPKHRPDWVRTEAIETRGEGRFGAKPRPGPRTIDFCVVDDLPTLIWVANLASLELHTSLAKADDVQRPTAVVFDLDPGEPAALPECADVALLLRELFEGVGLESRAKTSGSKGMQLYVPLDGSGTYAETTPFAKAVAGLLEREHPKLVVSRMAKDLRRGKVFVDWSQNSDFKTTVCAYSLRAMPSPTVSAPLNWDEVAQLAEERDPGAVTFGPDDVLDRIERHGDLFAPVASGGQRLPALTSP